ncbi:MAG: DUF4878 domain-containing protein [Chitinivibrionia bacterium]|nr:DUF4878 domain-containing protein [Chitinivibrionia bacterium]
MRILKWLIVLLTMFSAMFFVGCGSPKPSVVAENFYAALAKGDWETVGKYSTSETITNLTPYASKAQSMVAAYGKAKAVKETIEGDKAIVVVEFENKKDDPDELNLIKVDGKWKVHLESSSGK